MAGGMNHVAVLILILCFLTMGTSGVTNGAATAPSPSASSPDCSSAILNLADCLTFVEEGSKMAKPEKSCCSGLKKVVKDHVSCLCEAFKQSASFGVSLNMTKALSLPASCGVHTPSFSKCNIAATGVPLAAPAPSPGASTSTSSAGQSALTVPAPSPVNPSASTMSLTPPSAALLLGVSIVYVLF